LSRILQGALIFTVILLTFGIRTNPRPLKVNYGGALVLSLVLIQYQKLIKKQLRLEAYQIVLFVTKK